MQKYKEINGNDYVKNSRTTINETMQSIQSMNSGIAFPTTNLFEGMKCYRTDLKKTYTLTDVENNTWVEDAHATLSDEATHAATATKVVTTAAAGTSANIAEATMASSDSARIRVSGAENAGELALETADDGNEAIVARQYTGTYTTPVRTAKILDESGNTSLPGTVVAPKFTGSLNGNAAKATKLATPRTLSLTGKASGSATFDGSANASINVTSVNADTASKLSTARKINITGNASGSASFDGTSDVSINVSVSQAAHADKATADVNGNNIADTYVKRVEFIEGDLNDLKLGGLYANPLNLNATAERHYPEVYHAGSVFVINNGANGNDGCTQVYTTYDTHNSYKREYDVESNTWSAWRRYAFEDSTVASAQKLSTARKINITGNATGSAAFDGSGDVSISTTVNESKHAAAADSATTAANANKLSDESGSNHVFINTEEDSWSVIGPNPGNWLKSIRTDGNAPPYSIGNYSAAIAFGGGDTKGIITHTYNGPNVKFAGGNGSTAVWKFTIYGGYNNEIYDLNNFPTKTGGGASGTWDINISGKVNSVSITKDSSGNIIIS